MTTAAARLATRLTLMMTLLEFVHRWRLIASSGMLCRYTLKTAQPPQTHRSKMISGTDEFRPWPLSRVHDETGRQSGQDMNRALERLRGKNVVVLGASRGVGRETVRRAFVEGASVLAVARGRDGLEQLAEE